MNFDNDLDEPDQREREISLGTTTILGIFLALALVCAAFFGFGYSLGRRSAQPNATTPPAAKSDAPADSTFSNFKAAPVADSNSPATSSSDAQSSASPDDQPASKQEVALPEPAKATTRESQPASFPLPAASPANTNGPVVQVSATSRRGDADALIAALKRKGYDAAIRSDSHDSLFHVQIGPFANKKDADATRQRLDTDGYKAIVK